MWTISHGLYVAALGKDIHLTCFALIYFRIARFVFRANQLNMLSYFMTQATSHCTLTKGDLSKFHMTHKLPFHRSLKT